MFTAIARMYFADVGGPPQSDPARYRAGIVRRDACQLADRSDGVAGAAGPCPIAMLTGGALGGWHRSALPASIVTAAATGPGTSVGTICAVMTTNSQHQRSSRRAVDCATGGYAPQCL